MVIRLLPCFVLCSFFYVQSMENCVAVPLHETDFEFSLLFEHPECTIRETKGLEKIEGNEKKPDNAIKNLIGDHFLFGSVTVKDINTYLESNQLSNINDTDDQGRTLLDVAVDLRDTQLIEDLKEKGANLEQRDPRKYTVYMRTVARHITDNNILKLLYKSEG